MELNNGQYQVQGINLTDLAEEFGTPLYVYDADKMVAQLNKLKEAFSGVKLKVKYAAKSLTNPNVLKLFRKHGAELDVVSIQEARLGLMAGFRPEEILYTPNCVSFEEIQMAVEMGLTINIDNIATLEHFGHEYHGSVPVCIRINPHILAGGNHKIQVGHVDSKFGISVFQMAHVRRVVKANNMKVIGMHMHTGSDILDSEVFIRAANVLFEATEGFADLEFIDLGSGFKVAYREGDITTNIAELGKRMTQTFREFCDRYGKELELWFEPGKFLVSESGVFLVKTNVIKHSPAAVFAGVDSGLNHLIRPMMYDAYHEITNISNPGGTKRVYTVVGYICETDTFGWDRKLTEVRTGDILAIHNAGAYGHSMASNYNSRYRPAEVLVLNGKAHLIRQRETFEDLVRGLVEIEGL